MTSVGKVLVAVAAILVVIGGVVGGGAAADHAQHGDVLIGALLGGVIGLFVAGIFQIAGNTVETARLLNGWRHVCHGLER